MVSCGIQLMKYSLLITNALFIIFGLVITICSGLVLASFLTFSNFLESYVFVAPAILIIIAVLVFLVSCMACCGVLRESYGLLLGYAGFLLLIIIIEVVVGIFVAATKTSNENDLKKALRDSMRRYRYVTDDEVAWDYVHRQFKCCGMDDPADWAGYGGIPDSCCNNDESNSKFSEYCLEMLKGKYVYKKGCFALLEEQIQENEDILLGVGLGIAFVEIAGFVLSLWLAILLKQREDERVARF